jgi:Ca2+-binding EF-hand superfamily protein
MGQGMGRNKHNFSDCDLNGDGKILEKEFYEARNKRIAERVKQGYQMRNLGNAPSFADIDANKDGQISPKEFITYQLQRRQQRNRFISK